jgi:hypothetical protein
MLELRMKANKYEVWVAPAKNEDGFKNGFKIGLKPPVFRLNPKKLTRLLFVSQRKFRSLEDARGMADYLFGGLEWKPTKTGCRSDVTLSVTPRPHGKRLAL